MALFIVLHTKWQSGNCFRQALALRTVRKSGGDDRTLTGNVGQSSGGLPTSKERLGYPVSGNVNGIGDDDVTIECVDIIVSHIARVCAILVTRHKLVVPRKYRTA